MPTISGGVATRPEDALTPNVADKYDSIADGFSDRDYTDAERYAARRAQVVARLGPRLDPGDSILDLGCGDGIMAGPFLGYGLTYRGIDASERMVEAARRRHPGLPFEVALSEEYEPPEPVDVTVCLRSFYYPPDRLAFVRKIAGYTRKKLVFDFRPSAHPQEPILRDLRAAGFSEIEVRPFFLPQMRPIPDFAIPFVLAFERTGPLAMLASRRFGTRFCMAKV